MDSLHLGLIVRIVLALVFVTTLLKGATVAHFFWTHADWYRFFRIFCALLFGCFQWLLLILTERRKPLLDAEEDSKRKWLHTLLLMLQGSILEQLVEALSELVRR